MKRRIVLLGPPASGKGTQAEMIADEYQLSTASPGAILREEKRVGTALGVKMETLFGRGKLVPDAITNQLVEAWLGQGRNGFVLDGYPRTHGQAEALDKMLARRSTPLEMVISLQVDSATIRDRVERRLVCLSCGKTLSLGLHVANKEAVCPKCGGMLVQRNDDTLEMLALRMNEYAENTEPLISYYTDRGWLQAVDARHTPDLVFQSVKAVLESA